jgi:hypothetical protein
MNYGICIDGDVMVSHMYSENVSLHLNVQFALSLLQLSRI